MSIESVPHPRDRESIALRPANGGLEPHRAFSSGCPVQPAVIRWGNSVDTITWTWEGPGVCTIFLATLLQPHNPLEIEFLPVYVPSEEEQADPQLYAQNVRAIMAKALSLPTTDLSFDDCRRIRTAAQLNLPMACQIIEYGRLTRMLFSTDSAMERQSVESVAKPSRLHRITSRLRQIAEATRLWYTQLSTSPSPSPALANLENIFLRDVKAEDAPIGLLRQLASSLPKTTNCQPDLRILVVHLCLLLFAEAPLQALRLSFQVYDRVASSPSPERQKTTAVLEESVLPTVASVLADSDATADLADWAISPEDVEDLLHAAYLLKAKDTRSLLKKHRSKLGRLVLVESVSAVSAEGDAITPDNREVDALLPKHTANTLTGVFPDALYNALSMDYPKLVNSYADYRSEMQRIRRRLERPFSDTASSSASVSSIYSLNDPTNSPATETLVNAEFGLPPVDAIFAHKPAPGHQRTDSNVSSESEQQRGDLILVYNIINDLEHGLSFEDMFQWHLSPNLRGHSMKLRTTMSRLSLRSEFFTQRVVEKWNDLPQSVVEATSLQLFKKRLDDYLCPLFSLDSLNLS
nr:unnamed protein product [Spirometra erinaceieuropaei]